MMVMMMMMMMMIAPFIKILSMSLSAKSKPRKLGNCVQMLTKPLGCFSHALHVLVHLAARSLICF